MKALSRRPPEGRGHSRSTQIAIRASYGFSSLGFSVLPSTEQDWLIQPGPPRLGMRHPRRRYQRTTAISNNQTQLISLSLPFRVPVYRLPGERTRHHPSFCSRPSSPGAFRSRCPIGATATPGQKTTPRPRSPTSADRSFFPSWFPFFSGRSRLDHPVIREGSGR